MAKIKVHNTINNMGKEAEKTILWQISFWGLAALIFLAPLFRGLFFPEEQQKALLFALLLFWVAVYWKWHRGNGVILNYPMDYLMLSIPVIYVISAINAANTGSAVNEIVKSLLYFIVYWLAVNVVTNKETVIKTLKIVYVSGFLVSIAGLFTAVGLINIKDGFVAERIYSTFQYANALASYLAAAIILSVYLLVQDDKNFVPNIFRAFGMKNGEHIVHKINQCFYIISSYIMWIVFVAAKSNGGFIVLIFALGMYIIGLQGGRRIHAIINVLIMSLPAVPCSIMFVNNAVNGKYLFAWLWILTGMCVVVLLQYLYGKAKTMEQSILFNKKNVVILLAILSCVMVAGIIILLQLNPQAKVDLFSQLRIDRALGSAEDRMYFYNDAIKMVEERPVFGWGGGGWQEAYQMFQGYFYTSRQVHGYFLQIAVETGLVGLSVIILIWACFVGRTFREIREAKSDHEKGLLLWTIFVCAFLLGVHALVDFNLSLSAVAVVLWTLMGLAQSLHSRGKLKKEMPAKMKKRPHIFIGVSVFSFILATITFSFAIASTNALEANKRVVKGDLSGAIALLEKAEYYNPFNADYSAYMGSIYAKQGKLDLAINSTKDALAKSRYSAPLNYGLTELYLAKKDYLEAVTAAEAAVSDAPYNVDGYERLARAYFVAGYNMTLNGNNDMANIMLANTVEVNKRIVSQMAKLGIKEKILWQLPPFLDQTPLTLLYEGASMCLLGEYEKAEKTLKYVSSQDEVWAEASLWLSVVYQRQGKQEESNALVRRVQKEVPDAEKNYAYIFKLIAQ